MPSPPAHPLHESGVSYSRTCVGPVAMSSQVRLFPWTPVAFGAAVWLGLGIAAVVLEATSDDDGAIARDYTLSALLFALTVFWGAAAALLRRSPVRRDGVLATADWGGWTTLAGGVLLFILFAVRLFAAGHFGGRASAFDFGLKCAADNPDCTTRNVAFVPEFNSFGHCIQGCLSLFLFPRALRVPHRAAGALEAIACWLLVYPAYNVVKRTVKSADSFAASSFANNGSEWAMGFMLGISAWMVVAAWCNPHRPNKVASDEAAAPPMNAYVAVLRWACGILLLCVACASAVLFGRSWDNTNAAEHEDNEDKGAILVLVGIVVVVLVSSVVTSWRERAAVPAPSLDVAVAARPTLGGKTGGFSPPPQPVRPPDVESPAPASKPAAAGRATLRPALPQNKRSNDDPLCAQPMPLLDLLSTHPPKAHELVVAPSMVGSATSQPVGAQPLRLLDSAAKPDPLLAPPPTAGAKPQLLQVHVLGQPPSQRGVRAVGDDL
eukprot:TRINITY_DN18100_c0_g2_i1.p1 TRINITY_DN18100_c0_g2~~TRINITY_DN18100_c0_g2_i1.p1  ORF type:complete len:493 (+),score=103.98 TRINITY_DN18100_c0_g2_i1:33-1511(+)